MTTKTPKTDSAWQVMPGETNAQLEKRQRSTCKEIERDLTAATKELSNLIEAIDKYGISSWMLHPRLQGAISSAKSFIRHNVLGHAPMRPRVTPINNKTICDAQRRQKCKTN